MRMNTYDQFQTVVSEKKQVGTYHKKNKQEHCNTPSIAYKIIRKHTIP